MTTFEKTTRPPVRPPTRSRGPDAVIALILVAVVLGSAGFALTLTPGAGAGGVAVLLLAGVLLVVGLDRSVREELDTLRD
ncbi:hypothetical protein ACT3SP_01695 [Brachybacterium sp. AOP43-C2-M15]|uniref:hypothetical protein n=1 Tax=Brachybacterium sp. AOP43-C2-M15 TaxID=3457661 RepID=UPI004033CDAA